MLKLGLLGMGVVGGGVYELAKARDDMDVKYVLDLRDFPGLEAILTRDLNDILSDSEVDTVVELMGGIHPALEFVTAALEAGKNVVTANKALVAHAYEELTALAKSRGVAFRCTAAAGGGIPWLHNLERAKRVDEIEEVSGIMNGTTNYIMDTMTHNDVDFAEVLKTAQELGYAERDPSADIDGWDIQRKVIISANVAFDVLLKESDVPVYGIRSVSAADIASFKEKGLVCKLIATAKPTAEGVCCYVEPTLVGAADLESAVPTNYNLISFVGKNAGPQSYFGQGAGRYPTAYNVVQDLVDLNNGVKAFYTDVMNPVKADNANVVHSYYVRCDKENEWLKSVTKESWGAGVLTEAVSLEKMHAFAKEMEEEGAKVFFAGLR